VRGSVWGSWLYVKPDSGLDISELGYRRRKVDGTIYTALYLLKYANDQKPSRHEACMPFWIAVNDM